MFGFKKELYTPEYQLVGDECAVIETSKGTIKVKFDGEGAPIHVANFCELSTMGFYDGLKFHRYVPGFVIQGGDPNTRDMSGADVAAGLEGPDGMPGTGGPGYCIKGEFAMLTARLPWPAPWIPIPRARSSTSAWVPSTTSTPAIPSLAPRSRASTSSRSCAPATRSFMSRSFTSKGDVLE